MTRKKRIIGLTIIILFILLSLRMLWIYAFQPPERPEINNGILQLTDWNNQENRAINLDGDWEFYPNVLLDPTVSSTEEYTSTKSMIHVPQSWNKHPDFEDSYGVGTYRLVIELPDNKPIYALYLPSIQSASKVYINGELKYEMGHPAVDASQEKTQDSPYHVVFQSQSNIADIIIQVSNHILPGDYGGIVKSIKFGTEAAVVKEMFTSSIMQVIVAVVLLLHGVYGIILYFLGSRNRGLLYLAATNLCMLCSTLVDDDKVLLSWIPMDSVTTLRLRLAMFLGAVMFLILSSKYILNISDKSKKWIKWHFLFSSCFVVCALVLPVNLIIHIKFLLTILVIIPIFLLPSLIVKSFIKGEEAVVFLLISGISISLSLIFGIFKHNISNGLPFYPIDLIVAFGGLASFWFINFSRTNIRAERLALRLSKANKQKDVFLANTSHELQTPLHGMINMAQTVLDHSSVHLDDRNKEHLKLIVNLGQRMSLLIHDLLDISLLKEKNVRLHKSSLELQAVVEEVLKILHYIIENKSVIVQVDIPNNFPRLMADENRLIQILFNLLHNAIKFTDEGTIVIHAEVQDEFATISIKDSGRGMDKETMEKIFLPYEQGEVANDSNQGGIGLGLSISKQLVELHGGTIEVESAPNEGAQFSFTIPLDDAEERLESDQQLIGQLIEQVEEVLLPIQEASPTMYSDVLRNPIRPKILAVDDDPINLKILRNILTSTHYDITSVTSSKEALSLLDTEEWSLIIVDVMMPQLSGYELTKQIRQKFSLSELPILLLTARSRPEDMYAGFMAGASDYLIKPINSLELKTRVRALIDLQRSINERLWLEAAWLQAQIQPHFLFNTLNTIASLSEVDINRMIALLEEFGNYLQASFHNANLKRVVPLQHELELLRSYLYIEQERFGDRLKIIWLVPEQLRVELPPLSIQPLVENAIKHGILVRASGGTIIIQIKEFPDLVEIQITDDGVGMTEERVQDLLQGNSGKERGIGLLNTDRRLKQLYGHGLNIQSVLNHGTTISFIIPKN